MTNKWQGMKAKFYKVGEENPVMKNYRNRKWFAFVQSFYLCQTPALQENKLQILKNLAESKEHVCKWSCQVTNMQNKISWHKTTKTNTGLSFTFTDEIQFHPGCGWLIDVPVEFLFSNRSLKPWH